MRRFNRPSRRWALSRTPRAAVLGYTDLAGKDEVYALLQDRVRRSTPTWRATRGSAASQVGRFLILHKELDPDDDELTRTRKVRRAFIGQKYGVLVDAL